MSPTLLQSVLRAADARTPDAELLARFTRDRDGAAFTELVRRHGPLVWAVCRQLLPHHADAEDAFQATFLALVRGAGGIRTAAALPSWLHGVAVRVAMKARRAAARRKQREQKVASPEAERPVPDAAWATLMAAVHEEVRRLPDAERTAFVLCDLEGVRQPDAAVRLGWPLGTLSGRLCKARQRLLELLTRRGIAPGLLAVGGLASTAGTVPAALAEKVISFPTALAAGIPSTVAELARGLVEGVAMRTKLAAAAVLVAGALGLGGGALVLSNADARQGGASGGGGATAKAPPSGAGGGSGSPFFGGQAGGTSSSPFGRTGGGDGGLSGTGGLPNGWSGVPLTGGLFGQTTGQGAGKGPATGGPGGMGGAGGGGMAWAGGHTQWEYKFVDQRNPARDTFEKTLTQHGNDGWEYVGSEQLDQGKVLVFKRPKGGGFPFGGMGMPGMGGMGGGRGGGGGEGGGRGGEGGRGGGFPGGPGGLLGGLGARDNTFEVFRLKNVNADDVVAALQKAFPAANLRAVAERNSNSVIIVSVDAGALKGIAELIEKLDAKPEPKADPRPRPGGMGPMPGGPGGEGGAGVGRPPMGGGPGGPSGPGVGRPPGMGPGDPMGGMPMRPGPNVPGVPGPGGPMGGGARAGGGLTVITLKHATANEITSILEQVFGSKVNITPDARTNQLIVRADDATVAELKALLDKLDVDVPKRGR